MKYLHSIIAALIVACTLFSPENLAAGSQRLHIIGVSAKFDKNLTATDASYVKAIMRAGGVPIVIPLTSDSAQIDAILNILDGVVIIGGEDVDPLRYYGEEPIKSMGTIRPELDTFDYLLIRRTVKKGLPLLGICRGEQMLNVAFGGSLYQDIPSQVPASFVKHAQNAPAYYATHSLFIEKGSVLADILKTDSTVVNSTHHQAIKKVAPGFKVTARARDGIIEGIQMIDNPHVFGVQFHPEEFVAHGDDTFIAIFKYLINAKR